MLEACDTRPFCQPLKVSFEQMFGYYFPAQPERFHSPRTEAF